MDNESLSGLQVVPADHPLRLLIQAYTRLALITAQADGTKMVSIARCGAFDLRLIEFPLEGEPEGAVPLWGNCSIMPPGSSLTARAAAISTRRAPSRMPSWPRLGKGARTPALAPPWAQITSAKLHRDP